MRRHFLGTVAAVGLTAIPGAAGAADYLVEQAPFDWSGLYAGLHAGGFHGYATIVESDDGGAAAGSLSGFIGGALVGYGWQHNNFVFGVEGDFGFSNASGTGDVDVELFTYDLHSNAHLRGVVGWAHGNFKPFIAGGLAVAHIDVAEYGNILGGTYAGWTIGGGIDARFTNLIIGRAEVLYDNYGSKSYPEYVASLTGWTARLAIIFDLGH